MLFMRLHRPKILIAAKCRIRSSHLTQFNEEINKKKNNKVRLVSHQSYFDSFCHILGIRTIFPQGILCSRSVLLLLLLASVWRCIDVIHIQVFSLQWTPVCSAIFRCRVVQRAWDFGHIERWKQGKPLSQRSTILPTCMGCVCELEIMGHIRWQHTTTYGNISCETIYKRPHLANNVNYYYLQVIAGALRERRPNNRSIPQPTSEAAVWTDCPERHDGGKILKRQYLLIYLLLWLEQTAAQMILTGASVVVRKPIWVRAFVRQCLS